MTERVLKSNYQSKEYDGPINLLTGDYPTRSIDQNQAALHNMYLVQDQSKGEYELVAYPTPGLEVFCDTTQANVRALLEHNEVLYAVAGNKFYSINSGGTKTELGTLNTSSGFAKMVVITGGSDVTNQIVIIDGTNGYHYNIGTATAQFPITDADFPQTAADICTQDDYVIVLAADSISFFISATADGTTWSALDFGSKTGQADRVKAICSSQRRLYLMGSKTIEPYYNSADPSFPFERVLETFMQVGVVSKRSVVNYKDNILFLGKSEGGGYQVMQITGYKMEPRSDDVINAAIGALTTKTDAIGMFYQIAGHEFYDLTFPTDGRTFTLDLTTGAWINRQSYVNSAYTRFIGQCTAFCYDKSLTGDYNSGKIYTQSVNVYTENGTAIRRMFVSPPIYFGNRQISIRRLTIDVENNVGASKTFTVEKSKDSGRTWSTAATFTIGDDNNNRLYINGLGIARKWMFRITTTMNAPFILLGFIAEAELCNH